MNAVPIVIVAMGDPSDRPVGYGRVAYAHIQPVRRQWQLCALISDIAALSRALPKADVRS